MNDFAIDTADDQTVATMLASYVEVALWSSTAGVDISDDGAITENPDSDRSFSDHNFDADDLAPDTLVQMHEDVADFLEANLADLLGMSASQAGHDFWLTRNGHGTGFWDRGLGERGDRLTAACKPYGTAYLYTGADGVIHSN